jgi:hypothetical protein
MPAIKLQPETVDIIDAMFAFNELEIANDELEDDDLKAEQLAKIQRAKMDWLGYKTFIGM